MSSPAGMLELINRLSSERGTFYRLAANGHRGDPIVIRRIHEIGQQLEEIWELRRRERVGQRDGIDLLIVLADEATYGAEDAASTAGVGEDEDCPNVPDELLTPFAPQASGVRMRATKHDR